MVIASAGSTSEVNAPVHVLEKHAADRVRPAYSAEAILRGSGSEPDGNFRASDFSHLDLHLLRLQVPLDTPPSYVEREPSPEIDIRPPKDCPQLCGLKNFLERESYRQIRGRLKRYWRDEFVGTNMPYSLYEERLLAINGIGRDPGYLYTDYYSAATRDNVFRRKREAEEEIPVVRLGPLFLLDSGSLSFDTSIFGRLLGADGDTPDPKPEPVALVVGPGSTTDRRPLFSGKSYRLHTDFRVAFNPLLTLNSGNPLDAFPHYGAIVEIAWLSDILRRERFTTECEAQYGNDGDLAVFFNLVLKSW
jgi:hypothetical protein